MLRGQLTWLNKSHVRFTNSPEHTIRRPHVNAAAAAADKEPASVPEEEPEAMEIEQEAICSSIDSQAIQVPKEPPRTLEGI